MQQGEEHPCAGHGNEIVRLEQQWLRRYGLTIPAVKWVFSVVGIRSFMHVSKLLYMILCLCFTFKPEGGCAGLCGPVLQDLFCKIRYCKKIVIHHRKIKRLFDVKDTEFTDFLLSEWNKKGSRRL